MYTPGTNPTATLIRNGFLASRFIGAYNPALSCRWRPKHHDATGANVVNVPKCRCRVNTTQIYVHLGKQNAKRLMEQTSLALQRHLIRSLDNRCSRSLSLTPFGSPLMLSERR